LVPASTFVLLLVCMRALRIIVVCRLSMKVGIAVGIAVGVASRLRSHRQGIVVISWSFCQRRELLQLAQWA
jgi:hypothetical protein